MIDKIKIICGVLLAYLFGYRAYTVYAKWKSFDNRVIPFDTVLLQKGIDIHSGIAMSNAIDQVLLFNVFKNCYTFDHLETTTIFDYLNSKLILY